MATKGKKPTPAEDWEALPASHAPAEDWEGAANPSDARAKASPGIAETIFRRGVLENPMSPVSLVSAVGGDVPTTLSHALNAVLLRNPEYVPAVKEYLDRGARENPGSASFGTAAGNLGLGVGTAMIPGGIPAQIAAGAAMGAGTKPEMDRGAGEDLMARGQQGLYGGGISALLLGGGKLAGKGGDWLMQKAVGRNKNTPGVGTTLANEGIVGTRAQMRGQVGRGKERAYQEMLSATAGNPAVYDSMPVAQRVLQVARPKQIPGAAASPLDQPYIGEVAQNAIEIGARSPETLSQMLHRRAAAGNRAYSNATEAAKQGVVADISKAEQIGYSGILKNAAPEIIPADKRYSALAKASHALRDEDLIRQADGSILRIPRSTRGIVNYLPTSWIESILGQTAVKGSQVAPAAIPAAVSTMRVRGEK